MDQKFKNLSSVLTYSPSEPYIPMPNEIFKDLHQHINSYSLESFAYSYYYMYTYFWRCAKIGSMPCEFDTKLAKKILGYSPINKKVDYIIKKNGVLDIIGYTETTTDIPIETYFDAETTNVEDLFSFFMLTDYKKKFDITTRTPYKYKKPIKSFHRNGDKSILDGTWYKPAKVHFIHPSIFIKCMSNPEELGTKAFYMYGIIRHVNSHSKEWKISREDLLDVVHLGSKDALLRITNGLEINEIITVKRHDFKPNITLKPNEYNCLETCSDFALRKIIDYI